MLKFCMLLITISLSGESATYGLPVPGISELPDSISNITNSDTLLSLTLSKNKYDRINAAIRLGQIGGQRPLEILLKMFDDEGVPPSLKDINPNVKFYVLWAMGKIGGSRAEEYLFRIASEYSSAILSWPPEEMRSTHRSDSIAILSGSFNGLAKIATPRAASLFDSICNLNNGIPWVRMRACECYYKSKLTDKQLTNMADSMDYLLGTFRELSGQKRWDENGRDSREWLRLRGLDYVLSGLSSREATIIDNFRSTLSQDDPSYSRLGIISKELKKNRLRSVMD